MTAQCAPFLFIFYLLLSFSLGRGSVIFTSVFFYFFFSALRIFSLKLDPWRGWPDSWRMAFDYQALSSLFWVTLIILFSFWNSKDKRDFNGLILKAIGFLNAALILIGVFYHQPWGLFSNASMSGCFSAVIFPLFFKPFSRRLHDRLWSILIPLSALITWRHQPLGLLFALLAVLADRRLAVGILLLMPAALLFDSNGRLGIWVNAMSFWKEQGHSFFGLGMGSFEALGTKLSVGLPRPYIWLHSDWLTIIFEQGYVGLFLMFIAFLLSLYALKKSAQKFTSLFLYGLWACANMPLHYPVSGYLGACLLAYACAE